MLGSLKAVLARAPRAPEALLGEAADLRQIIARFAGEGSLEWESFQRVWADESLAGDRRVLIQEAAADAASSEGGALRPLFPLVAPELTGGGDRSGSTGGEDPFGGLGTRRVAARLVDDTDAIPDLLRAIAADTENQGGPGAEFEDQVYRNGLMADAGALAEAHAVRSYLVCFFGVALVSRYYEVYSGGDRGGYAISNGPISADKSHRDPGGDGGSEASSDDDDDEPISARFRRYARARREDRKTADDLFGDVFLARAGGRGRGGGGGDGDGLDDDDDGTGETVPWSKVFSDDVYLRWGLRIAAFTFATLVTTVIAILLAARLL